MKWLQLESQLRKTVNPYTTKEFQNVNSSLKHKKVHIYSACNETEIVYTT
jgi:hypothetical protein